MSKNNGIDNSVGPIDGQHASQTARMKDTDASYLSGVDAPSIAAVEQHADGVLSPESNFIRDQRLAT